MFTSPSYIAGILVQVTAFGSGPKPTSDIFTYKRNKQWKKLHSATYHGIRSERLKVKCHKMYNKNASIDKYCIKIFTTYDGNINIYIKYVIFTYELFITQEGMKDKIGTCVYYC
jgi:hypothetical protein